jgi:type IV pilus assembly protein PilB
MARISRMTRKRLGELLVENEVLSREDLDAALERQRRDGRPLGEVLVEEELATEEDIARVIAKQNGLPFIDPRRYAIDDAVRDLLPEAALIKYRFVPLDVFGESMLIAASGVLTAETVEEIEKLVGRRLHVMVGTVGAVRQVQMERFHDTSEDHLTGLGSLLLGEDDEDGGGQG